MIGEIVSHYRIVEKLGEGGMGVVYKAEDTKLRRAVALKFLPPHLTLDREAKQRFIREAQAASALDHPNIAVVHEIDETDDGRSYICMAYYAGKTLKERIAAGPVNVEEAVRIAAQIAEGLQRAHEAGIVHRDIKPANIIVTERGEVKIVDFGLAKLASGQSHHTRAGPTAGTAAYMSPEQITGGPIDLRSDLFSLGVVMYEMVTGRRPFEGDHEPALFYAITNTDPQLPSTIVPTLPPLLDEVISKLLKKDPAERYPTAAAVLEQLSTIADLRAPSTAHELKRKPSRRLIGAVAGILAVVVILAALNVAGLFDRLLGPAQGIGKKVLIILPFAAIGEDPANRSFCDGLVEVLTAKLSELGRLDQQAAVVPALEVRHRQIKTAEEARQVFGVTHVISGSMQRTSPLVRVTLNLYSAETLHQINSAVIDANLASASELQDHVFQRLLDLLEVPVQRETARQLAFDTTRVPDAFDSFMQARGSMQQGLLQEAIELFRKSIDRDSLYIDAYGGLASAYESLSEFSAAESTHRRAIAVRPEYWLGYNNLGAFLSRRGRFEEARAAFERVVDLEPKNVRGYNNLGGILIYSERWPEAKAQFERSLTLKPNYVAYSNLGVLLFYEGGFAEATRMYERALEFNSRDYRVWGNVASGYYWTPGGRSKAAQAYRTAVQMAEETRRFNPADRTLLSYLADFYAMLGKKDSALSILRRLDDFRPEDPQILARMAEVYESIGLREEAFTNLRQALESGYSLTMVLQNPALATLRRDPAFEQITKTHEGTIKR